MGNRLYTLLNACLNKEMVAQLWLYTTSRDVEVSLRNIGLEALAARLRSKTLSDILVETVTDEDYNTFLSKHFDCRDEKLLKKTSYVLIKCVVDFAVRRYALKPDTAPASFQA